MKLRYQFVIRAVGGSVVAVAVGKDNELFNGMVRLNSTGEVIFRILNEHNATQEEILSAVAEKYNIPEAEVSEKVLAFIDTLRRNGLLEE